MSFAGSGGTGMSVNPFDVDVDEALREFGAPGGSAPGPPSGAASDSDGPPEDANGSSRPPASDQAAEQKQDGEQAAGEAPSNESSGSDVIHIDLTQRPPPLPMSGLALEELINMLPGSTYAVSGSGVRIRSTPLSEPVRTSPRVSPWSDARQGSPSAKASPKGQPAGTAAAEQSGDGRDGGEAPEAESALDRAGDESDPGDTDDDECGEGATGSGHVSPHVALTFIPGVGLCPVVIHDVLEDDEDEDYLVGLDLNDGDSDGAMFHPEADLQAPGPAAAAGDHDDHHKGDGVDQLVDNSVEVGAAAAHGPGAGGLCSGRNGGELQQSRSTEDSPCPAAGAHGAGTAQADGCMAAPAEGSGDALGAVGSSKQLDISEEQLKSIIQQAMHGLDFRDVAPEEEAEEEGLVDDNAGDEDGDDGEKEQPEQASHEASDAGAESPERQALFERLFGGGAAAGRPASADSKTNTGRHTGTAERSNSTVRQLLGAFDDEQPGAAAVAAEEAAVVPAPAAEAGAQAIAAPAPARANESSDEYEDDLVVDEGIDSLDEVDDSGSGGGDEPESMLGGLGHHARMGLATDPAQMAFGGSHPTLAATAGRQFTATTVDADGIHPQLELPVVSGFKNISRGHAATAGITAEDPHAAVLQGPVGGGDGGGPAGGLQLPRPRYRSHTTARSYDGAAAHAAYDEDEGPTSGLETRSGFERAGAQVRPARISEGSASSSAAASSGDGSFFSSFSRATSRPDTAASTGSSTSGGGGTGGPGTDLNSTLRTTAQSLAAIRLAALQAEGQRMARSMAERLGGGADKAPAGDQPQIPNNSHPAGPRAASSVMNPFGFAEHEASAAAGLVDVGSAGRSGGIASSSHHGGSDRRGSSGRSTGYAQLDSRHRRQHGAGEGDAAAEEEDAVDEAVEDEDVEDLLRDRSIIQPRYPTDAKKSSHHHHHHHHHVKQGKRDTGASGRPRDSWEGPDHVDLSRTMESDGRGSWRPRHRRSFDVVDLDALSEGGDADVGAQRLGTARSKSADGSSPPSPPSSRSLLATRKSDDGQFPGPPQPSSSPRMQDDGGEEGSGSDTDSATSSSARSVADERLADELEALRDELGQKTTLVAGLRGELRKYTDLAMRLQHQLAELRSHNGEAAGESTAAGKARTPSQSDTGSVGDVEPSPGQPNGPVPPLQIPGGGNGVAGAVSPAAGSAHDAPPLSSSPAVRGPGSHDGAAQPAGMQPHTLPPHPQAQGLEGAARLTQYTDILSAAQAQVERTGGPAPPDLRDAHELLKGKDVLDAGTEKVMLMKLQKMLVWGCEAAWKAAVAQQQNRYMKHAAQQAAQARSAWEAERQELKEALEEARAAAVAAAGGGPLPWLGRSAGGGRSLDGGGAGDPEAELRRQLQQAQDDAALAREQTADLESAVASLNADVRRLRGQLRNSYDGGAAERNSGDGSTDAASGDGSRADSKAWAMERKMLLSTITGLQHELQQQVRAASEAAAVEDCGPAAGASPVRSDEAAKKLALAEAAMERVQALQAERDAVVGESADLRRKLEQALEAAHGAKDAETGPPESRTGEPALRGEVEQLRQQLAAARDALERRTADAEAAVALHEAQSAELRAQVADLRRDLAVKAAELVARAALRDAEQRRVQQEQEAREAAVRSDALARELRQQLAASEAAREEMKAALSAEERDRSLMEEKLRLARDALAAAVLAGEEAAAEAMARRSLPALDPLIPSGRQASVPAQDLEEALRVKISECEHLQRLVEARAREVAAAESQLEDVRAAVAELQAEASETQAQVAGLHAVLQSMQSARETAEAQLAGARAAATAAEERASDAHAASLLAEAALARAVEEAEALRGRVSGLEDELEGVREEAGAWRGKAEEAEGALAEARAVVAGLQAEARDLRTALSAEDTVQAQLIGQVECLERELETQASLAQRRSQQAERMKAALAEAEAEHHRHDNAAAAAVDRATAAAAEELRRARAATAAAQQRAAELEARVVDLQLQLVEERNGRDSGDATAGGAERRHADVARERALTEPQVPDLLAQMGSPHHAVAASPPPPTSSPPPPSGSHADERQRTTKDEAAEAGPMEQQQGQGEPHQADMGDAAAAVPNHSPEAAAASAAALKERLHVAEQECAALRSEVSDLRRRRQQDAAAVPAALAAAEDQLASLRSERARLLADCSALTAELHAARAEAVVRRGEQAQVEALRHQLQIARSELQAARADLQSAGVELSVKAELMAAKDRSLATLQETVDALKLALQVTQQNIPPVVQSPRRAPAEAPEEAPEGDDAVDRNLQKYKGTVAALQSKFADSESTIRRLEKQVAALETKLSDESLVPTPCPNAGLSPESKAPQLPPSSSRQQLDAPSLELQLKEKEAETARLMQELLLLRKEAAAPTAAEPGAAGTVPPGSVPGVGPNDGDAAPGAAASSLQTQLLQWRTVSEDLHARYQSKKETVRRLREQLAAEQQRRAAEQAQTQAQLQAASQRLGRLAADLGTALRRCIALDLQPLSATTLTTSPRAPLGGGAMPDDINALASLLARQGAALVESLEAALDQVNTAREERALVTAQLANRQAVLDELRHHLARQAVSAPGQAEAGSATSSAPAGPGAARATGRVSPGLVGGSSRVSPTPAGATSTAVLSSEIQSSSSLAAAATGGGPTGSPLSAGGASLATAGSGAAAAGVAAPSPGGSTDMSTPAAAAPGGSSASQALHAAALNLAQDMAALSAQQAGVRSALQSFEQRPSSRPRSLSGTTYPLTVAGSGAYPSQLPLHTAVSYQAISPLRGSRTSGAAVDALAALTATVPSGSPPPPPHSYVGILSGSRIEPCSPLGAASTGGGLHTIASLRQGVYGMYGQAGTSGLTTGAPSTSDAYRALDAAGTTSSSLSPTRLQFYANGGAGAISSTGGGGVGLTSPGALGLGLSSSASASGVQAASLGLGLSRERRMKLADTGL